MNEKETWQQVEECLTNEFNANPNNTPDKSVFKLDWYYEQNYPYFTYKTILIDGVGLTVFKYIELDRGNDYKTIFHDWGYIFVCPAFDDPDREECNDYWIENGDYEDLPHFPTVTEAIVAAQNAAIKYLEDEIKERQVIVDKLKGQEHDKAGKPE